MDPRVDFSPRIHPSTDHRLPEATLWYHKHFTTDNLTKLINKLRRDAESTTVRPSVQTDIHVETQFYGLGKILTCFVNKSL